MARNPPDDAWRHGPLAPGTFMPTSTGIRIHGTPSEAHDEYSGAGYTNAGTPPSGDYNEEDIAHVKENYPEAYEQSFAGAQGVLWGENVGTGLASDPIEGNVERRRLAVDTHFQQWDRKDNPWAGLASGLGGVISNVEMKGPATHLFESGVPLHHLDVEDPPQFKGEPAAWGAGMYTPSSHTIQTRPGGSKETTIHELGHALHLQGREVDYGPWPDDAPKTTAGHYGDPQLEGVADGYRDRYTDQLLPSQLQKRIEGFDTPDEHYASGMVPSRGGYSPLSWKSREQQETYTAMRAHVRSTGEIPHPDAFGRAAVTDLEASSQGGLLFNPDQMALAKLTRPGSAGEAAISHLREHHLGGRRTIGVSESFGQSAEISREKYDEATTGPELQHEYPTAKGYQARLPGLPAPEELK